MDSITKAGALGVGEPTGDMVFLALPVPLYKQLAEEAAKRQLTLAQFLAGAVSEAVQKPIPSPPQYLTEG